MTTFKYWLAPLITWLLVFWAATVAATPSDNWVKPDQTYWKFTVTQEGVYKLGFRELQKAVNQDISNMNPAYFKLYRLGKEQPLNVQDGNDGSFDVGDQLVFYGRPNDATLDSGLYMDPSLMPNPYQSLYTASAAYFVTWAKGKKGRRYQAYNNTDFQQYAEQSFFVDTAVRVFQEEYNSGNQLNNDINTFELSYYTEGEGWTSNNIVHWTSKDWNVQIPGHQEGIAGAPDPSVKIKLHGATKCDSGGGFNPKYHHKTRVEVDRRNIGDFLYKGYETKVIQAKVPGISGSSVNFDFFNRGVIENNLKCDFSKISYISVAYPRKLEASQELSFSVPEKNSPVFVSIDQFKGSKAFILDPESGTRINPVVSNGKVKAIIPPRSQGHRLYLTSTQSVGSVKTHAASFGNLSQFEASKTDYLIITHKKLQSSAEAYKDFRSKVSNLEVGIAYIDDIYNRYSYGQHHALGIRYFLKNLVNNQAAPEYLLLLGKGLQPKKLRQGNLIQNDLVPTIGQPPTDNLFVVNLEKPGQPLSMAFPVGRIPASNNQEVLNYLQKIKTYRNALKNGETGIGRGWRKQFLHLSGGETKRESKRFKGYLADYADMARNSSYGAEIDVISKNKSIPIDKSQKDFVINAINEGRNLVTYFGHGASEILEVDIGDPADYQQEKGNYPVFLFSGCIIGNSYTQGRSLPEQFLVKNPKKGGVAWMAESSFSFESYLDRYTLNFYKTFTGTHYGESLGKIFTGTAHAMRREQGARDYLNEMQILQKTFHGDPALNLYAPQKPDYTTASALINFQPSQLNASLDSITLKIGVENVGKVMENDSLYVTVTQELSNLNKVKYGPRKFPAPDNKDTFSFKIAVDKGEFKGNNTFSVRFENQKGFQELDTTNNSASVETFIPSSSITPLEPPQYSIVRTRQPELKVQANNLRLAEASYQFQVDTNPNFNSPALRTSPTFQGSQFGKWQPELLDQDSTVYYWRAKKVLPDETSWVQQSFMYIDNSPSGWAQGHYDQLKRSKAQSVSFFDSPASRHLQFDREPFGRYNIVTTGATRGKNNPGEYAIRYEGPRLFFGGAKPGIYILAIDPNEPARLNYQSPYNTFSNVATKDGTPKDTFSGVFQFNWVKAGGELDTPVMEDFIAHVQDSIPEGYKILAFTNRQHLIHQMPDRFYEAMERLGSGNIQNIKAKWPYILIGEKGYQAGEALEKTADTSQPLEPDQQLLKASKTIFPLQKQGTVTSQVIGPSAAWEDAYLKTQNFDQQAGDSTTYKVIGLDQQGNASVVKRGLEPGAHSLRAIDAAKYPFLRLKATLSDPVNLTPSQLNTWLVHYDFLPEGSLIPQVAYSFHSDTVQQGEQIRVEVAYQNISDYPMDSLEVSMVISNNESQVAKQENLHYRPLASGDTLIITDTFATDQLAGQYRLQVKVNPDKAQPERYLFNNVLEENFVVKTDKTKPALDVTFNDRYIKNNAFLNPQPFIRIKAIDDNNFYLLADTSRINVTLTYPSGKVVPLNYKQDLNFKPATSGANNEAIVTYKPADPLPAGQFTLSVTAKDVTGNSTGSTQFTKNFRVAKNTAIVDFRASPNPFSDRTRFLFTLKGEQVPETMRIRIYSTKGDLIRVISHEDLAPLHLGENQTSFLWDGRTKTGQSVASGVYLYTVEAYIDGTPVPFRTRQNGQVDGDRFGKLILTR